jgi:hypothetical protein
VDQNHSGSIASNDDTIQREEISVRLGHPAFQNGEEGFQCHSGRVLDNDKWPGLRPEKNNYRAQFEQSFGGKPGVNRSF